MNRCLRGLGLASSVALGLVTLCALMGCSPAGEPRDPAEESGRDDQGAGASAAVGQAGSGGGGAPIGQGGAAADAVTPCPTPSIDRYQRWLASGEGVTVPASGSLLVADGDRYVGRVQLIGNEWHVVPVWLANKFEAQVDLSASSGFELTYRSTADLYVQLRPASQWSGGDQWALRVPSTGGEVVTRTFAFDSPDWASLFGAPPHTLEQTRAEARGLVFVGNTPNDVTFYGLRVDGYAPPCL